MLLEKERVSGRLRSLPGRRVWRQGRSWERSLVNSAESTLETTLQIPAAQFQLSLLHFGSGFLAVLGCFLSGKRDFQMLIKAAVFGWG